MSKGKFRVGDKVRYVKHVHPCYEDEYKIGEILTVNSTFLDGQSESVRYKLTERLYGYCVSGRQLELVEEDPERSNGNETLSEEGNYGSQGILTGLEEYIEERIAHYEESIAICEEEGHPEIASRNRVQIHELIQLKLHLRKYN